MWDKTLIVTTSFQWKQKAKALLAMSVHVKFTKGKQKCITQTVTAAKVYTLWLKVPTQASNGKVHINPT